MKKKAIKKLSIFVLICYTLAFIASMSYIGFYSSAVRIGVERDPGSISFVLVNEDVGAYFNGIKYLMGNQFVYLTNHDVENQWQTASRSTAEAGFRNGIFDVIILLPQNFSERLLSLQSFTPRQAQIIYQVRSGYNELVNIAVHEQVGAILDEFNRRVVQMYFSSILDNLFDAQRNVANIILGQQTTKDSLLHTVQNPFGYLPEEFDSVIDGKSLLEQQNARWQQQQDNFSYRAGNFLTDSAERMLGAADQILTLSDLHNEISRGNFETAQRAVALQAATDEALYKSQFDSLYGTAITKLEELFRIDEDDEDRTPIGMLAELIKQAQLFYDIQSEQKEELETRIQELHYLAEGLLKLREETAKTFFGNPNSTPENMDEDEVRDAIGEWVTLSNAWEPIIPHHYMREIARLIADLRLNELGEAITFLANSDIISFSDYQSYSKHLDFVMRYAFEAGVSPSSEQNFRFANIMDDYHEPSRTFRQTVSFPFSTEVGENIIALQSTNGATLGVENIDAVAQSIQNQINTQLSLKDFSYVAQAMPYGGGNQIKVIFTTLPTTDTNLNNRISGSPSIAVRSTSSVRETGVARAGRGIGGLSERNGDTIEESNAPEVPAEPNEPESPVAPENTTPPIVLVPNTDGTMFATVDLALKWTLSPEELGRSYNKAKFQWLQGERGNLEPTFTGELSVFVDLEGNTTEALMVEFPSLLSQLRLLGQITDRITTVFGGASPEMQNSNNFISFVLNKPDYSIIKDASGCSVFLHYGNLNDVNLRNFIIDILFFGFIEKGIELFNGIDMQYEALQLIIGDSELEGSLEYLLENIFYAKSFLDQTLELKEWHEDAMSAIQAEYDNWQATSILDLQFLELSDRGSGGELTIFFDSVTGARLYESFVAMAESSAMLALSTGASAASIESLEGQFLTLIQQAVDVRDSAEDILGGLDYVMIEAAIQMINNLEYSENFNSVMANARVGGADNQEVFHFLTSPIERVGTRDVVAGRSTLPYFMTLIGALIGLAIGNGIRFIDQKRVVKELDKLKTHTRVWENTPTVVMTFSIAAIVALVFGFSTRGLVGSELIGQWLLYVGLLTIGSILVVSFLARQLPRLSIYIIGAILGVYLLLTPMLGVNIEPRTGMSILFNLSPLQNIENGYMLLMYGYSIGWFTYLMLLLLIGLGVVLNLVAKEKEQVSEQEKPI